MRTAMIMGLLLALELTAAAEPYQHPSWTQVEYIDPFVTESFAEIGLGGGYFHIADQLRRNNAPHLANHYEIAGSLFLVAEVTSATMGGVGAGLWLECNSPTTPLCSAEEMGAYTNIMVTSVSALVLTRLIERITIQSSRHRANRDLVKYLER